jgi:hypothetical protein
VRHEIIRKRLLPPSPTCVKGSRQVGAGRAITAIIQSFVDASQVLMIRNYAREGNLRRAWVANDANEAHDDRD